MLCDAAVLRICVFPGIFFFPTSKKRRAKNKNCTQNDDVVYNNVYYILVFIQKLHEQGFMCTVYSTQKMNFITTCNYGTCDHYTIQ